MDQAVELKARALAKSIRARKEALRFDKSSYRTSARNEERIRITGMVQALAIMLDQAGSMGAAEDFVEKWRHDDDEVEIRSVVTGMTKAKLRLLLRTEGGDGYGQVQICVQNGQEYAYYEVGKVTFITGTNPVATVIETGKFISGG